jgi:hypothetical protein
VADEVFKGLERRIVLLSSRSWDVQDLGMDLRKCMIPANEGPESVKDRGQGQVNE